MGSRRAGQTDLSNDLLDLLGLEAFIAFTEAFGGVRLYIAPVLAIDHEIVLTVGVDAARKLAQLYSPDVLRVPLAREVRAKYYRSKEMSNAAIARKLGVTETTIDKIFGRHRKKGDAPPRETSETVPGYEPGATTRAS